MFQSPRTIHNTPVLFLQSGVAVRQHRLAGSTTRDLEPVIRSSSADVEEMRIISLLKYSVN